MYVMQLDNGRTILTDASNKMAACEVMIDMIKSGDNVARILHYSGQCINPTVTVVLDINEVS